VAFVCNPVTVSRGLQMQCKWLLLSGHHVLGSPCSVINMASSLRHTYLCTSPCVLNQILSSHQFPWRWRLNIFRSNVLLLEVFPGLTKMASPQLLPPAYSFFFCIAFFWIWNLFIYCNCLSSLQYKNKDLW
jgi:hypothetical protein